MMKSYSAALFLCIVSYTLRAQPTILSRYVEQGIANNLALKQQNLELEKALMAIEIAKSNYYPRISFAPTYSVAFGGRKIEIPIGDLLNPVYSTLNKLTNSHLFPQVENTSEQLAPMNFHDTKFEFKQSLFNSDITYNITLQKDLLNTERAKKKFLEYELKYSIEVAYYQVLQSLDALKIYKSAEKLAQDFLSLNKKLYQQDAALKNVVLSAEYELSKVEQQQLEAVKNSEIAKAYFNFLLNRNLEEQVILDSNILKALPNLQPLAFYTQNSQLNRPEFEQLNAGLQTQSTLTEMQRKNAYLPQFYLGVNAGFQGFGYTFQNQAYVVGQVGMNWQIFNAGEKKMKLQQTKITSEVLRTKIKEVTKQIEMQVYQKFKNTENSLAALRSKKKDTEKLQNIYGLVYSRYKNGVALPIEVTKAQNDLLIAQLSKSVSQLDTWINYAELKKVSGL